MGIQLRGPAPGRADPCPYKSKKTSETYRSLVFCTNCGHDEEPYKIEIPKGVSVKVFVSGRKCNHCGCIGYYQQYIHHVTGRY